MFQRILVPLDGSPRAEQALPLAARLARASRGRLILARIVQPGTALLWAPTALDPATMRSWLESATEAAEAYLQRVAALPVLHDVPTEKIVRSGLPADQLLRLVPEVSADLLVLCSHGYRGLQRWALGSVALKLIRHASLPVLVLRSHGEMLAGPQPGYERPLRAVVPLDGSVHAKAALEPAAAQVHALATPAPAALHLLAVVEVDEEAEDEAARRERERRLARARRYLAHTVEQIRAGLVAPKVSGLQLELTWSVHVGSDVAQTILDVVEHGQDLVDTPLPGGCDLLAMSTHGREGLNRWLLGSVTERVLERTRLPLLVVRPQGIEETPRTPWGTLQDDLD
ncbi:universal stress protein [Thermogemmatispora onikobensis]|uniref:universal stress protein n=1 Tax=Thermogemmatispora onikobensis TaxID=732234 RepID=UPI000853C214|nr:universal stress protein [Thermogemmatispora onikobensis]